MLKTCKHLACAVIREGIRRAEVEKKCTTMQIRDVCSCLACDMRESTCRSIQRITIIEGMKACCHMHAHTPTSLIHRQKEGANKEPFVLTLRV